VTLRPPAWDWSFAEDGNLALDRHEVWTESQEAPRLQLSQSLADDGALHDREASVSVRPMPRERGRTAAAQHRRAHQRSIARRRRVAGLVVLSIIALVTLLLTAFGSGRPPVAQRPVGPAPANRLLPSGPPNPQVVALEGALRIQLPVAQSRLTAIGYHASGDGALALDALGTQANPGTLTRLARRVFGGGKAPLRWYQIPGGAGSGTAALDIGAAAGTDVYAPVDGTVMGLTPYIVNGRRYGSQIDIQPTGAPSLVVSITHVKPDPSLTVGASIAAGTSKLGLILDFSNAEEQALAHYTQDAGNHVEIEVHPAAALSTP
jgi:murein DD-endopeptidase MepM/ murein hydrolase activator NlpD